jgi:hypothetical protein
MCQRYFSHVLRVGQYIFKCLAVAIAIGQALKKFKDLLNEKIIGAPERRRTLRVSTPQLVGRFEFSHPLFVGTNSRAVIPHASTSRFRATSVAPVDRRVCGRAVLRGSKGSQ